MNDLEKISHNFQLRILRRAYTQLLTHGAEMLYGPSTSVVLISAVEVVTICMRAFLKR